MSNEITNPEHYKLFPDMEAVDVIRKTLTQEEFIGYCKGNSLKYRLRAGKKGDCTKCIAKAEAYESWLRNEKPRMCDDLWYPDDSGEWIEYKTGDEIKRGTLFEILTNKEREYRLYAGGVFSYRKLSHNRSIVAYKVIK